MRKYPSIRVIIWFSLCPALYGLVSFVVSLGYALEGAVDNNYFMPIVLALALSFLSALVAFLVCLPASFAIGVIHALLKLYKGWIGYSVCFFIGGIGAYFWWYLIYPYREAGYIGSVFSGSSIYDGVSAFTAGALFSLVASFWALPRKE